MSPFQGRLIAVTSIVLFDSVPGGTGYLHELLLSAENLRQILRLAQQNMADCSCQNNPDLDGCYSCLYAYRNSYGMENTSRRIALEMLADILDESIVLEQVDGLSKIKHQPWVDSELEARFADALRSLNQNPALNGVRVRVSKDIVNGKPGFTLEVGDNSYRVEPQVEIGHGVLAQYPSKPDFVIWSDRDSLNFKPIAIFLDGYAYHKKIVHENLLKRQSLIQSGEYLVWFLTWHDINQAFAGSQAKTPNVLLENSEKAPWPFIKKVEDSNGLGQHQHLANLTPLIMLAEYLRLPELRRWQQMVTLRALCWLDKDVMQESAHLQLLEQTSHSWPSQYLERLPTSLLFSSQRDFSVLTEKLVIWIAGGEDAIKRLDASDLLLMVEFDQTDSESPEALSAWQKLLQFLNIGQFLPIL